ncbi:hypothetical protein N9E04_00535, partial [bacterium]|nr:hypothetical protein [bacterium]
MGIKRAGAGVVATAGAVALTAAMLSSVPTAAEPTLPPDASTTVPMQVPTELPTVLSTGAPLSADATSSGSVQCEFQESGDFEGVNGVFAQGDSVYAATYNEGLGISTDGGQTYTMITKNTKKIKTNAFADVYAQGDNVYATGAVGMYISSNGGRTWDRKTTSDFTRGWHSIFASGDTVWAGSWRYPRKSTKGTKNKDWKKKKKGIPFRGRKTFVVFAVGETVYATSQSWQKNPGALFVSTNGGDNWTPRTTSDGLPDATGDVFAQGDTVYVTPGGNRPGGGRANVTAPRISTDAGTSFSPLGPASFWTDVVGKTQKTSIFAQGDMIYVGTLEGLAISADGGQSFELVNVTHPLLSSNFVNDVYAV